MILPPNASVLSCGQYSGLNVGLLNRLDNGIVGTFKWSKMKKKMMIFFQIYHFEIRDKLSRFLFIEANVINKISLSNIKRVSHTNQ